MSPAFSSWRGLDTTRIQPARERISRASRPYEAGEERTRAFRGRPPGPVVRPSPSVMRGGRARGHRHPPGQPDHHRGNRPNSIGPDLYAADVNLYGVARCKRLPQFHHLPPQGVTLTGILSALAAPHPRALHRPKGRKMSCPPHARFLGDACPERPGSRIGTAAAPTPPATPHDTPFPSAAQPATRAAAPHGRAHRTPTPTLSTDGPPYRRPAAVPVPPHPVDTETPGRPGTPSRHR